MILSLVIAILPYDAVYLIEIWLLQHFSVLSTENNAFIRIDKVLTRFEILEGLPERHHVIDLAGFH